MAKVLLVDTNFSSRPIYDAIARHGHEVHVVGGNPNDCLAKSCPHYWHINYADTEALAALVARERFAFLVPGCTDRSYSSCATISRGQFPGIESVEVDETLNHKDRFRALAQRLGLPVPQLQWQDSNDAPIDVSPDPTKLRWPLVVKPVDAFSGKGVSVLQRANTAELHKAVQDARAASARGRCLVETYIVGQLYSHSAFLKAGQIVHDVFVMEHGIANPFVVDTSRVLPQVDPALRQQMRQAIEALAKALSLGDGLVHTQFILDGAQPWLIELTRRCPGDLYSQLIELSGGKGYVENYVRPFLGMSIDTSPSLPYVPILRHTVTVPIAQGFNHVSFHQPVHIERMIPLSLTGDRLHPSPASRVGILFARARNEDDLTQLIKITLARKLYEVVQ